MALLWIGFGCKIRIQPIFGSSLMSDVLHDLSSSMLVNAIEQNLFSLISTFGKIWEARVNDPPGVIRSISDIPVSLFNSIMDARLTSEDVETTIQYLVDDAWRRKVPILWWVGPSTLPTDLPGYLQKYGFAVDDDGPGMAVVLSEVNENQPMPAGFSVQTVQDDSARWEWCRTMAAGFGIPATKIELLVNSWHYLLSHVDPKTTRAYLGMLDGKPVATSLLQLGGGVAGIFGVATVPEARQRGFGAQVTLFPLLQARLMGYKAAILQASEMGFPVYRSLGFQEYCRISSYIWRSL
jgi:ribosomal protein S18 acetylase RimI-like enzyme